MTRADLPFSTRTVVLSGLRVHGPEFDMEVNELGTGWTLLNGEAPGKVFRVELVTEVGENPTAVIYTWDK